MFIIFSGTEENVQAVSAGPGYVQRINNEDNWNAGMRSKRDFAAWGTPLTSAVSLPAKAKTHVVFVRRGKMLELYILVNTYYGHYHSF